MNVIQPDEQRLRRLRKLTQVSRSLTYAVSLGEVLHLAVEQAAELLDAPKALVMLVNDDGVLSVRASQGIDPELATRFAEPLNETLTRRLRGLLGDGALGLISVPLVVRGEVTGILAVGRPPGARNEDEEEWLLSALADQTAVALENTRLDETMALRERLIGITGHDLRSPLSAIRILAGSLLRAHDLSEKQEKSVRRIESTAIRMSMMVGQLLDLTRGRLAGGIPIAPTHADLLEVCKEVLDELAIIYPRAEFRVEAAGPCTGRWDRERLAQVVSNLAVNAANHGAAGVPVTLTMRADGSDVILAVHNLGPPIPPDLLPRVFEPFRHGSAEPSGPSRGLGLGLYITQQIVSAHKGEITVRSSAEEGTTFTVRLPRGAVVRDGRDAPSASGPSPVQPADRAAPSAPPAEPRDGRPTRSI